jgi:hypothetical protein
MYQIEKFIRNTVNNVSAVTVGESSVEIVFDRSAGLNTPVEFKEWLAQQNVPFSRPGLYRFIVNRFELAELMPEEPEDPYVRAQHERSVKVDAFVASLTPEQREQFEEIKWFFGPMAAG